MFKIVVVLGVIFYVSFGLFAWAMCVAAGRADRWTEERQSQINEDNWWH